MLLLEIEELRVRTRHKELVHGIDLDIEAGEWLGSARAARARA